MTLSTAQLTAEFTNVNEGFAPDAATQLLLSAYAQQTIGGGITDAAALSLATHIPPPADGSVGSNTPENTTDVALGVYQFFTGMAPTLGGLDFLVNNDGGVPLNPNDLDSAYYAGFNQANRYYNFAINLITGNAAVAANFAATYGAATFDQVVTAAYESIVGTPNVGAAQAAAAIAAIEAQLSYFQAVAAERAPGVNSDLATKAIAIAFIIEEGVKANVGYYAFAIDAFNTILAGNPEAVIPGETAGGINLLTAFPIVFPGQTFTLTPGVDTITPPATDNNIVNGDEDTFTAFDSINLGSTTGNVFNWVDSDTGPGFDTVVPTDVVVAGVQTFNVSSAGEGLGIDTTSFSGLTTLNVDIFSYDGAVITAGPTTAVDLTYTDTGSSADIEVNGGSVITIEQDNPIGYDPAFIEVNGGPGTTEVDITQTGDGHGNIEINDYYATIANVSLTGLAENDVSINGGSIGLANLTVSDAYYSDIFIDNSVSSPGTLNLTLDHDYSLFVEDSGGYSALNVVVAASTPFSGEVDDNDYAFGAFLSDPTFSGLKTETVTGGVLAQNSFGGDLGELESIVVGAGAGFIDLNEGLDSLPELTLFDASASNGPINVSLNAAQTAFIGGSGVDFVEIHTDATVSIAGGSSGANEILLDFNGADLTAGGTYANVTGFQILGTGDDSVGTYDLGAFAVAISDVDVRQEPTGALIFLDTAVNQTLTIDADLGASGGITLVQGAAAAAGSHNVLNLTLGTNETNGIDTSNVGSGFINPVGTDVSVPEHSGNLAPFTATTVSFFDTGTDLTSWMDAITLTATPNGGTLSFKDTTHSITTSVTFTSSVAVTDANFFASQVNVNDPNVTATVSLVAGHEVVTITSNTAGTAGNLTASVVGGSGTTGSTVVTAGTDASPDTGSITVTNADLVANELHVNDKGGQVGSTIILAGGESTATVAADIEAQLKADGYTGVSLVASTVSFTYPTVSEGGTLSTTDYVAQVDTLNLTGVPVVSGDVFSETFLDVFGAKQVVTEVAGGGDTTTTIAAKLTADINALSGTTDVVATSKGATIFVTTATGFAQDTFTTNPVNETTFNIVAVGGQAITANNYQTVNVDSAGVSKGGGTNTTLLADGALTTLNISGTESLLMVTSGGAHLSTIDTTGVTTDAFINLLGVLASEVTTGISANLGNSADVNLYGNASAGHTDVITGTGADVSFWGTGAGFGTGTGGNTVVTLGDGFDDINLFTGKANVVTLGNGHDDLVYDHSNGADHITLGNGHDDFVLLGGSGNSTVILGNGADSLVDDEGSGNNHITFGNGDDGRVVAGSGMDTVVFGTGSGDSIELSDDTGGGHGIVNVTFGGALASVDLSSVFTDSFLTPTTTSQVDILTNNVSVVNGLVHGDTIELPTSGDTLATAHNMAGVAGEAIFTTGTYSGGGGTFTEALAGADALLTYDSGGGHFVSVVLVGGAAEISHATIVGDTITF